MGLAAESHKKETPLGHEAKYILALEKGLLILSIYPSGNPRKRSLFISTTMATTNKKENSPGKKKKKENDIARSFLEGKIFREGRGNRKGRAKETRNQQ